jgi:predicted TIM-barrel fold metal-dependent hydrolase
LIIDSHTHIFPPEIITHRDVFAKRDPWFAELYGNPRVRMATAENLIAAMDTAGIDHAITFSFGWSDPGLIRIANDYVIDAIHRYPKRLTGFAVIQPLDPQTSTEIERCASAGLRGIGELMPHGQGYQLSDIHLLTPMAQLAEIYNLIILTHVSEPVGHRYPGKGNVAISDLITFLESFPLLRVIAAHWGGGLPFYHLMPEVASVAAQCWYDTAASPYLYHPSIFSVVAQSVGIKKILWASDYPLIGYQRLNTYTAQANLSDTDLGLIRGMNAAELLGIT